MSTLMPTQPSKPAKSNSLSKRPMFPTTALFFNFVTWSKVMMLKLPVEETKMSISNMTVSMAAPSNHANRAQNGSHSARNLNSAGHHEERQRCVETLETIHISRISRLASELWRCVAEQERTC